MKKLFFYLICFFLMPTSEAASLCNSTERVYFSCQIKEKTLSLCGSPEIEGENGYIQYRFGHNKNQLEIEYPQKRVNATKFFTYGDTPYSRGWRVSVNFQIDQYRYSVHNAFFTDGEPRKYGTHRLSGVRVFKGDSEISNMQCNTYTEFSVAPEKFGIPHSPDVD